MSLAPSHLEALLGGRHDALADVGVRVPEGWPGDTDRPLLRRRLDDLRRDPAWRPWLLRALVLRGDPPEIVGHAGFHGPPGVNGPGHPDALELGYTVLEQHRGHGYAREAAEALIAWARGEGVDRFVASVAPENAPSLAIVRRLGFVQTGEQWDDEDGLELVFELGNG